MLACVISSSGWPGDRRTSLTIGSVSGLALNASCRCTGDGVLDSAAIAGLTCRANALKPSLPPSNLPGHFLVGLARPGWVAGVSNVMTSDDGCPLPISGSDLASITWT
jgi:hypothetical protein